jgi:hypothetical protein
MIYIPNLVSILLLALYSQGALKAPISDALQRLQAKVSVESLASVDMSGIAGRYTNPSKELVRRIGGVLSGDDLYLFPDGTYIYCEWSDVQPLTIYDKGKWTFTNGAVELKSDPDVKWDPKADRTYVAVRRQSHPKEILLVGLRRDLPYFEQEVRDDPESMLLIVSKGRRGKLTQASKRVKTRLLEQSWHPEDFKEIPTDSGKPHR